MNSRVPVAATALLTASAVYVGGWASTAPRSFYDTFPGLHRVWVSVDGPYNEHLVRDVGGLYLGLSIAGAMVLWRRGDDLFLVVGAAWALFSTLHLAYHLGHLGALSTADRFGEIASLTVTLLLALLVVASGRGASAEAAR